MKNKGTFIMASVGGFLTALLIVLIRFVDVAPIGPQGTAIGLSHLNRFIFDLFGVRMIWYTITDWLGVAAVLTACLFAALGFVQLVKRKSLFKVDKEILLLGALYIVLIGLYVLFERVIVNYRPIILPGGTHPEASFPSSHTLMVCAVMGSACMLMKKYIKNKTLRTALQAFCAVVIGVTVIGRLISGVHWFTDIVGGILISSTLLTVYAGVKTDVVFPRRCLAGGRNVELR
ncbi:MAG: phosphatase PAP2 family protein [Clostridia bacterium]|nr:phosphatase PAP2 family protein [Clostridia bacterium]